VTSGLLDSTPVDSLCEFEAALHDHLAKKFPEVLVVLRTKKSLDDDIVAKLKEIISEFRDLFIPGVNFSKTDSTQLKSDGKQSIAKEAA